MILLFPAINMGAELQASEDRVNAYSTRTNVDLGVENVSFSSPFGPPFYPGGNITINVTIMNFAAEPASSYDIICAVNDQHDNTTLMSKKMTSVLAPYQNGIDNITVQFYFASPVIPPPYYSFPHIFKVVTTISISNDENLVNNQVTKDLMIDRADFQPNLFLGLYDNQTGWVDPTGYDPVVVEVGGTVQVPFILENAGSGNDTIQIIWDQKPLNWTVSGFSPIWIADGENTTDKLNVTVTISNNNWDAMENYDHVVRLKAYSLKYPLAEHTLDIHFSIKFRPGIEHVKPYDDKWATPGVNWAIEIKLINKGNGKDSFYSSLKALENSELSQGWKAYIDEGTLTPAINLNEIYTIKIRVSVPPDALYNSTCNISLTSESNKAASSSNPCEKTVNVTVRASRLRWASLEAPEQDTDIYWQEKLDLTLNVTNSGNAKDDSIEARLGNFPSGWKVELDNSSIPEEGLDPGEAVPLDLHITIPHETPPDVAQKIYVEAWVGDPPEKKDVFPFTITILETYELNITVPNPVKSAYQGSALEFSAAIHNTGNVDDVYDIWAEMKNKGENYQDWGVAVSQEVMGLQARQSKNVIVTVAVPQNALVDPDPETEEIEDYEIVLTVRSRGMSEGLVENKVLVVNINPEYGFEMVLIGDTARISGDRDAVIPLTVNVTNTGNIGDIVDLDVESDHDWYTLVTIHKYVPVGQGRNVFLHVEPSNGQTPGTYWFDLKGTSRGDTTISRRLNISIEIVNFDFKIQNLRIDGKNLSELEAEGEYDSDKGYLVRVTHTVNIKADIVNTGDYYSNSLYGNIVVRLYDGEVPLEELDVEISLLETENPYTVTFTWSSKVQKGHDLHIKIDPGDVIPESNEDDNVQTVLINNTGKDDSIGGEDTDENTLMDMLRSGWWLIPLLILLVLIDAIIIFLVVVRMRKKREDTGEDPFPQDDRTGSEELYEEPELSPPILEEDELEFESGDIQEDLDEIVHDPNQQPDFEYDPDGVLAEISDMVSSEEKPSDFELDEGDMKAKLAEKFEKGEITEEIYNLLLVELEGQD
jgi:uncharacterized membrane protein